MLANELMLRECNLKLILLSIVNSCFSPLVELRMFMTIISQVYTISKIIPLIHYIYTYLTKKMNTADKLNQRKQCSCRIIVEISKLVHSLVKLLCVCHTLYTVSFTCFFRSTIFRNSTIHEERPF